MATRQIKDGNAIATCAFQVALARPFDPVEFDSFRRLEQMLQDALPAFARDGIGSANLPFGGFSIPFVAVPGITMQRTDNAGRPQRVLRIEGQTVSVTCNDFTVWGEVWPQVQRVLTAVLGLLNPGNFIVVTQLTMVDQFDFVAGTQYDAFELYQRDSTFLPAHVAESGKFWHVNHGWWQDGAADMLGRPSVLHNLNIANIQEGTSNAPEREYAQIEHSQAARSLNFPIPVLEFDPVVTDLFESLRQSNYELLRALLTQQKLQGMGL